MAGASVRWDGLVELKTYLRTLPDHLTGEAGAIVHSHARMAQQDVQAHYPVRTGNLQKGVRIEIDTVVRQRAAAVVASTAPHAWLYEHGSDPRTTKKGTDRGAMPEAPRERRAIPKFIRWRTAMYAQLAAMMERNGLKVTGSFGRAA